MNLKRTAAATAAAATIITGLALPHAEAVTAHPESVIAGGSVWDSRGASIWTKNRYGHTEILYQGQHAFQIAQFRFRFNARCAFVETGSVWSSGFYKAAPDVTHPTRNYGIDAYAWSKCPRNAKWISAVL